ncbi:MAG: hypothetical protein GY821_17830 [Gammaproteobacteria bacterium]|nr:hypothetical protein [Gammaproteobacteria bacterium]
MAFGSILKLAVNTKPSPQLWANKFVQLVQEEGTSGGNAAKFADVIDYIRTDRTNLKSFNAIERNSYVNALQAAALSDVGDVGELHDHFKNIKEAYEKNHEKNKSSKLEKILSSPHSSLPNLQTVIPDSNHSNPLITEPKMDDMDAEDEEMIKVDELQQRPRFDSFGGVDYMDEYDNEMMMNISIDNFASSDRTLPSDVQETVNFDIASINNHAQQMQAFHQYYYQPLEPLSGTFLQNEYIAKLEQANVSKDRTIALDERGLSDRLLIVLPNNPFVQSLNETAKDAQETLQGRNVTPLSLIKKAHGRVYKAQHRANYRGFGKNDKFSAQQASQEFVKELKNVINETKAETQKNQLFNRRVDKEVEKQKQFELHQINKLKQEKERAIKEVRSFRAAVNQAIAGSGDRGDDDQLKAFHQYYLQPLTLTTEEEEIDADNDQLLLLGDQNDQADVVLKDKEKNELLRPNGTNVRINCLVRGGN